jgi:hypothetical protein
MSSSYLTPNIESGSTDIFAPFEYNLILALTDIDQ